MSKNQTILTASEGMVYTNGDAYVKTVVLPKDADASVWVEIPEADMPKDDAEV